MSILPPADPEGEEVDEALAGVAAGLKGLHKDRKIS
jgi:hypothetical protein